tara:strand:+ start:4962 stop:5615 length:654 start_codon:yes stop_codon:yes gene_type:complete
MKQAQSKSKKRVADHGEVFTNEREVNAMLDLVQQETERIDSRFLEPACGTGNFLVEILKRKLNVVVDKYRKSQLEFERYSVIAISSIYGIDLLEDNAQECRERLLLIFRDIYITLYKKRIKHECIDTIQYILKKNILVGNALTLLQNNGEPILFSEWSLVKGSMIKRRDYTFDTLLKNQPMNEPNLFSDLGDQAFIPTPIKEYKLTHFLKLNQLNED